MAISKVYNDGKNIVVNSVEDGVTVSRVLGFPSCDLTGGNGWSTDGIANRTEPNGDLTISVTPIGSYAFHGCENIASVNFTAPKTRVNAGSFQGCTNLKTINAENVWVFGQNALYGTIIEDLVCPAIDAVQYADLGGMRSLKKVDLGAGCRLIAGAGFSSDSALTTIILRNPNGTTLGHVTAFQGTPFASGGSGGEIYVPQALIDSGFYTTATNWATYAEYGTITWKPIEGSVYQ